MGWSERVALRELVLMGQRQKCQWCQTPLYLGGREHAYARKDAKGAIKWLYCSPTCAGHHRRTMAHADGERD